MKLGRMSCLLKLLQLKKSFYVLLRFIWVFARVITQNTWASFWANLCYLYLRCNKPSLNQIQCSLSTKLKALLKSKISDLCQWCQSFMTSSNILKWFNWITLVEKRTKQLTSMRSLLLKILDLLKTSQIYLRYLSTLSVK